MKINKLLTIKTQVQEWQNEKMNTPKYEEVVREVLADACEKTRRCTIKEVMDLLYVRNAIYDRILMNALKILDTSSGSRYDKLWRKYIDVSRRAQAESKIIFIISGML